MLVIPALDLKNGCCVRLTQGEKDRVKIYDQDPLSVAEQFAQAGATLLHVVDLDGAFTGGPTDNLVIVRDIVQKLKLPVQFGGGVRDEVAIVRLIELGVTHIILGTIVVAAPQLFNSLAARYQDHLVVGIDARAGFVATHGWEHTSQLDALTLALQLHDSGIKRIIYTDIAQDGMLAGPNLHMTRRLAQESGLKVTASGGIGTLEDIQHLKALENDGVDSCIIGKALYERRFTLAEALKAAS
ncbi:MAG: 1-(5-phosphoribosyl)-5-[(5-phosphoribosylamino)methylideneamino]imidazole-4-carboxamide isomerase [Acidobacteriota bacterium]